MIKKLKLFLEDVKSKKEVEPKKDVVDLSYTKLNNNELLEWFKNVKPIKFEDKELEEIKKLIDFKLIDAFFEENHPYNYLQINTGLIYSLRRDYYLISLGNINKLSNYYCKGFPNLLKFIREKLVIK